MAFLSKNPRPWKTARPVGRPPQNPELAPARHDYPSTRQAPQPNYSGGMAAKRVPRCPICNLWFERETSGQRLCSTFCADRETARARYPPVTQVIPTFSSTPPGTLARSLLGDHVVGGRLL